MNVLKEFEVKISLIDGMLIETGGWFGKNGLDNYLNSCVEIAVKYYQNTKDKSGLINIIDFYMEQYKEQVLWKYYHYEMQFLENLKMRIEQL